MMNPFNLSSVSQFRDGAPVYQDPYRTFFLAKLTGKTLVGSVYNYDWTEQSFDTATGAATDANPCRSGSYAAGVANSPAVEANNANIDVTTPVYVFMKQKGIVNGQVYYEFQYTQVSSSTVSAWKEPVRVATTVSGTLASSFKNGDTVDGVGLVTGYRILLKNQSSGAENGIYTVNASGAPTRATDCDSSTEFIGATVFVSEGTVNADTYWTCTTNPTITVGTTATVWAQTPSASRTLAGYVNTTTQSFLGTKSFMGIATGTTPGMVVTPTTTSTTVLIGANSGSTSVASVEIHSGTSGSTDPYLSMTNKNNDPRVLTLTYGDLYNAGYSLTYWTFFTGSFTPVYATTLASQYCIAQELGGFQVWNAATGAITTGATGTMKDGSVLKAGIITTLGVTGFNPVSMADGSAANNTIYYSTTAGKLVYKDAGGTVNNLY